MPKPAGHRWSVAALAAISIGASTAAAQPARALVQRLDSIAGADVRQGRSVGTVAAVVQADDTLLLGAYGRANVEWEVPMAADAMFEIGSVTKQFTAVAILQLRDQGRLSLDDDITKWFPDFDARGNRVPLRRLLDHTSGIADVTETPEWRHLVSSMRLPPDSMYALIRRSPFQFPTGTAQVYNNSAFWLLGLVVEKASGMSYRRYVEERIFEPLGMSRSRFCLSTENVPRRASGYLLRGGTIRRAPLNVPTWYIGSGSLCSTAADLVTWLRALHGGQVLPPGSYAELTAPSRLADGTPLRYGMGLQVDRDARGHRYIGHSGEIAGYAARANWYPDARLAVVVLMNNSGDAEASAMAENLAGEVLPAAPPERAPFRGDAAPLVGTYIGASRGGEMAATVTRAPEGIAVSVNGAPARPLAWVEGLTFRQGAALLTFRRAGGDRGPVAELRYDVGSGHYVLRKQ